MNRNDTLREQAQDEEDAAEIQLTHYAVNTVHRGRMVDCPICGYWIERQAAEYNHLNDHVANSEGDIA